MEKKTKIVGGGIAIIALVFAGGLSLTGAALATPSTPPSTHSAVSDGDGETADDVGTETSTEDSSDDVNGVAVEDGTQD